MKTPPTTTDMQNRARELYQRLGPRVDHATAARLRAARRQALDARPGHHHVRWMVPAGACAAALLAVLTIWQPLHQPSHVATMAPTASSQTSDADMLPPDADQDPTLYQNMDFYAWLASQPDTKPGHGQ